MAIPAELKQWVERLPNPDGRGMFTENIDKEQIDTAIGALYAGGAAAMQGLIDMLGEPGSLENVKPHYALHCVLNQALIDGDEPARRAFCETLAANLDRDLDNEKKAYLCQELQWAGGQESVPALGQLLLDEDLVAPAAMALVAIRGGASEQFRAALPRAEGPCRLHVLHSLAALADRESAEDFLAALADDAREVRIAAGAGLATIGAEEAVDAMLDAAAGEPGWERIQARNHCLILAEKLAAAGKQDLAEKMNRHLGSHADAS